MEWFITVHGEAALGAAPTDDPVIKAIKGALRADLEIDAEHQLAQRLPNGWTPDPSMELRGGFDTGSTLGLSGDRINRKQCLAGGWFRWQRILLFQDGWVAVIDPDNKTYAGRVAL